MRREVPAGFLVALHTKLRPRIGPDKKFAELIVVSIMTGRALELTTIVEFYFRPQHSRIAKFTVLTG